MSTQDKTAVVRREDQLEINEFGKLNGKKKDLKDELQEVEKRLSGWEEAEEGVMLADESVEGSVKAMVGDSFVDIDSMSATEIVEKALSKERGLKSKLEEEIRVLSARQDSLKKKLYARFGSSISLDDPTDK